MQPGQPDVASQVPAGGGQNKPADGTYGEKAALARLESQLPSVDPAVSQATEALPTMAPQTPPARSTGLPPGLMAPTRQPNVPVSTPMAGPIMVGQGPERRVALWRALLEAPDVSEDTKRVAAIVLDRYRQIGL